MILIYLRTISHNFISAGVSYHRRKPKGATLNNSKEWYKTWWGVLLAIIFLPLFVPWWLWKKANVKPVIRIIGLIVTGLFAVVFYGVTAFAIFDSPGKPIINVPSRSSEQMISISGTGVDPNNNVTLLLNGTEFKTIQADTNGKFIFEDVSLDEGDNTLQAFAIRTDGKRKESPTHTINYAKSALTPVPEDPSKTIVQQPAEEQVVVPTEKVVTTPEPEKEPTIIDKLWKALDDSVGSRNGIDIQYFTKNFENSDAERRDNNLVRVTIQPKDYYDVTFMVKTAYREFITYGIKAFQIDGVDEIEFSYWGNITDQYGNTNKEKVVTLSMIKEEFKKYNWQSLDGQNIYQQMVNSCDEHFIHGAIFKNLKTDKLTLDLF